MRHRLAKGMPAGYRAAAVAFCNWAMETGRLMVNPFAKVAKAAEDVDPRRQRRA